MNKRAAYGTAYTIRAKEDDHTIALMTMYAYKSITNYLRKHIRKVYQVHYVKLRYIPNDDKPYDTIQANFGEYYDTEKIYKVWKMPTDEHVAKYGRDYYKLITF